MAYTDGSMYDSPVAQGNVTGQGGGGLDVTHGILILFLLFLGLTLFGEVLFRKINNAL
jgi:hypothetical protein